MSCLCSVKIIMNMHVLLCIEVLVVVVVVQCKWLKAGPETMLAFFFIIINITSQSLIPLGGVVFIGLPSVRAKRVSESSFFAWLVLLTVSRRQERAKQWGAVLIRVLINEKPFLFSRRRVNERTGKANSSQSMHTYYTFL